MDTMVARSRAIVELFEALAQIAEHPEKIDEIPGRLEAWADVYTQALLVLEVVEAEEVGYGMGV